MRKRVCLSLIVVTATACLLLLFVSSRRPVTSNILLKARRITNAQDSFSYSMLSENEMIVRTFHQWPVRTIPCPFDLDLINTATGDRQSLAGLASAIQKHRGDLFSANLTFNRSPDGKWFVWRQHDWTNGGLYLASAHWDGSGFHRWRTEGAIFLGWLGNSRFLCETVLVVRNTNAISQGKVLRLDAAHPAQEQPILTDSNDGKRLIASVSKRAGLPSAGDTVVGANLVENTGEIQIEQYKVGPGSFGVHVLDTLRFASNVKLHNLLTNRQQTKVLIQLLDPQVPRYAELLQRILPRYRYSARPIERVYIYDVGKQRLNEIGSVPAPNPSNPELSTWWADGNTLGFYYHSAVYTVPVD